MSLSIQLNAYQDAREKILLRWLVDEGQFVEERRPILVILADEQQVVLKAQKDGILLEKFKENGERIDAADVLGTLISPDEAGEIRIDKKLSRRDVEILRSLKQAERKKIRLADHLRATPAARRLAKEYDIDLGNLKGSGPEGRIQVEDVMRAAGSLPIHADRNTPLADFMSGRKIEELDSRPVTITPLALRMAKENGIDPHSIPPVRGRVGKREIMKALLAMTPEEPTEIDHGTLNSPIESETVVEEKRLNETPSKEVVDISKVTTPEGDFSFRGLSYTNPNHRKELLSYSLAELLGEEIVPLHLDDSDLSDLAVTDDKKEEASARMYADTTRAGTVLSGEEANKPEEETAALVAFVEPSEEPAPAVETTKTEDSGSQERITGEAKTQPPLQPISDNNDAEKRTPVLEDSNIKIEEVVSTFTPIDTCRQILTIRLPLKELSYIQRREEIQRDLEASLDDYLLLALLRALRSQGISEDIDFYEVMGDTNLSIKKEGHETIEILLEFRERHHTKNTPVFVESYLHTPIITAIPVGSRPLTFAFGGIEHDNSQSCICTVSSNADTADSRKLVAILEKIRSQLLNPSSLLKREV